MSRRKQRSAFDQVPEFDKGRIVAYRDCGLSFREIGSRVGRIQTTVMRICDRWILESMTDQRGRSHPPQCTTSREDRQIVRREVTDLSVISRTVAQHIESVTHHSVSAHSIASLAGSLSGYFAVRKHVVHVCSTFDPDFTPAASSDQLWQHVETAWSAVPQEHIQSLFESMPRRVAAMIYNNGGYSGY
ncbi:transposable element Tcb1 transposase [Trichonephila clavipes]|nr:transposable element Tcb1 transposase [Trichonephila clavipes]